MKSQKTPPRRSRPGQGFTLLETLSVLAILGVLAGLSVAAYDAVRRRGSLQNAANDLQGVLSAARSRAMARGFPVWVVFYPQAGRTSSTLGRGAWLQVDDVRSLFLVTPANLFTQPLAVQSPATIQTQGGVTGLYFLEDYGKKVRFAPLTPNQGGLYKEPFTHLTAKACSFCTTVSSLRGALVFHPDGGARFVDGQGTYLQGTTLKSRGQGLALSSDELEHQYLFAISPSGYATSFSP